MRTLSKQLARLILRTCVKGSIVLSTVLGSLNYSSPAQATPQPTGNHTNIQQTQNLDTQTETFTIQGGQTSQDGRNLFHQFETFDLNQTQTARFITQPTVENVLNLISGGASHIDGQLEVVGSQANLYLLNPAGILFGPNVQLNLPGNFTAATATDIAFGEQWLSTSAPQINDFRPLTGNPTGFNFARAANQPPSQILNLGSLAVAQDRSITLLANSILNVGTLSAPGGTLTLNSITPGTHVRFSTPHQLLALEASPTHLNYLHLEQTLGEASSLSRLLTGPGEANATLLNVNTDGTVTLSHPAVPAHAQTDPSQPPQTAAGTTWTSGQLTTDNPNGLGGTVNILGEQVIATGAGISANGATGGGTLRLGGDYRGSFLVPTAQQTTLNRQTTLSANAEHQGNGGDIFIWSNELTIFEAALSARGGQVAGHGGFAEVSSRENLIYRGEVDLHAPTGNDGRLLIDPANILIRNGTEPPGAPGTYTDPGTNITYSLLYEDAIEQLTNVDIEALVDLVIEDLIDNKLSLQPGANISLTADSNNSGTGTFSMNPGDVIESIGGRISISAGSEASANGTGINLGRINTGNSAQGGFIELDSASQITALDLSAEDIVLDAQGAIALNQLTADTLSITAEDISFIGGPSSVATRTLSLFSQNNLSDIQLGGTTQRANALNLLNSDIAAIAGNSTQLNIGNPAFDGQIFLSEDLTDTGSNPLTFPVHLVGNQSATLISPNLDTTWFITGPNQGYNDRYSTLTFEGIGNLITGGSHTVIAYENATADISESIQDTGTSLSLIGNDIILPDTLSGTGSLLIEPESAGVALELGGTDLGQPLTLNLTDDDLLAIQPGFSDIRFGNPTAGPITLQNDLTTVAPTTLQTGANVDGLAHNITNLSGYGLSIEAEGTIELGNIRTAGGNINIHSQQGSIETGTINSSQDLASGGDIVLGANNISTGWIDAQGLDGVTGNGGTVTITTDGLIEINGSFQQGGEATSIATTGGSNITLTHGGNGRIPFVLGNTTDNGAQARITNQAGSINNESLYVSLVEAGISILTDSQPFLNNIPNITTDNGDDGFDVVLDYDSSGTRETFAQIETRLGGLFAQHLSLPDQPGRVHATLETVQSTLSTVQRASEVNPALLYVYFVPSAASEAAIHPTFAAPTRPDDALEVMLIPPSGPPVRQRVWGVTREQFSATARDMRNNIVRRSAHPSAYLDQAQQLHQWMITPLSAALDEHNINNLAFVMADGLRTLPIAALHDGEQHLIERYSIGLLPTFSLTDFDNLSAQAKLPDTSRPAANPTSAAQNNSALLPSLNGTEDVLAMGASAFANQPSLPAVEAELAFIKTAQGEIFLNEDFTFHNLQTELRDHQYQVLHLATHAQFESGDLSNSYIQLWNERLSLSRLGELELNTHDLELIILSACNTALGDPHAEYGFAGFAVNTGAQSALASLWPVSDEGTMGFMTQFYSHYTQGRTRSEALRAAQLSMIHGDIRIHRGEIIGPDGEVIATIPALSEAGSWDFSHPFYWSTFTMIGNPW